VKTRHNGRELDDSIKEAAVETPALSGASFEGLVHELLIKLGERSGPRGLGTHAGARSEVAGVLDQGYNEDPHTCSMARCSRGI